MQKTMTPPGGSYARKPEVFYAYCYRTQSMRMMDIDDYLCSLREGYTQLQAYYSTALYGVPGVQYSPKQCGCDYGCECCDSPRVYDSCCECCICDGDVLIEARCSERRVISITFSNDSRRTRDVALSLSSFTTASGRDLGWNASLSETKFSLGPCEEKVISLAVNIDCSVFHKDHGTGKSSKDREEKDDQRRHDVDRCEVAYARINADGCINRPVLVAVAVLPNQCDSHISTCKCDCC